MKRKHLLLGALMALAVPVFSNPVTVKMNAVSTTMKLAELESSKEVELPQPNSSKEYSLELAPGKYLLSAYDTDGVTLNGTIEINVADSVSTQYYSVITCTAYVSNKDNDGKQWSIENGDYELNVAVNTREGERIVQTPGKSKTANRYTFLALNGNSYNVAFEPSDVHRSEGYMTLYRGGTLTANINVYGAIPEGGDFCISLPADAELEVGMKFTHFSDFTTITPVMIESVNDGKIYRYKLANGQIYNYRTWREGGLTHAGYFTMNTDPSKCPLICFTDEDFNKHNPKEINHSVKSNNGYETGDLLLNINKEHHLNLKVGESFLVHGMRMWELNDNVTNNYFFEPDLHFTILDTDFNPSDNVISIENCNENKTSAWSKITAIGQGTAIVLVTYDGINLNYYNNTDKKDFLGGEHWGAIWPENTGVFVVSVGQESSVALPNMVVNEKYNEDAMKLAGKYVDAEHDVFYYLEGEEGYVFSFAPQGVEKVEMASPVISETEAIYSGFTSEGIVKNEDGSYSVLLHKGRNIIRLTDVNGNSVYQIMSAKPCQREITNMTRPGSKIYQPGDQIKIQYSGLFHPANKIAGIYNMSAYITYNGIPNGSSLILGSGQYTFGSAPSAQAVTVEIPADYNVNEHPQWIMDEGVIQVNGFGDPIGNHRNTSPTAGRSPNFTAVAHKTYFGALPEIAIDLNPVKLFDIAIEGAPKNAEIQLTFNGKELQPAENGHYSGTYGNYSIVAKADGYQCFRKSYQIDDKADGLVTFNVDMELLGNAWDGIEKKEPTVNEDGCYEIHTPAELAWFAENVNNKGENQNAIVMTDLNLGNFDWTPIGISSSIQFKGNLVGQGHSVTGLYVDVTTSNVGLFGYMKDASITGLTVDGSVSGKQYVGGLVGYVSGSSTIDRCANYSDVKGTSTYVGGLIGYLNSATVVVTNCYNIGDITGTTNCGGVIGSNNKDATVENIFNAGKINGGTVGGCIGGATAKNNVKNAYTLGDYQIVEKQETVTSEQMASGEIAFKLGDAFFQTIGEDIYPSFTGLKVYYDSDYDEYYNEYLRFTDEELILDLNDNPTSVLKAIYKPSDTELPKVKWSSSDESVATVEPQDNLQASVKAMGEGRTIIKVEHTDNPKLFAACNLIVTGRTDLVESLFDGNNNILVDVYDLNGRIIKLQVNPSECRSLAPGLYIFRFSNTVKEVLIK